MKSLHIAIFNSLSTDVCDPQNHPRVSFEGRLYSVVGFTNKFFLYSWLTGLAGLRNSWTVFLVIFTHTKFAQIQNLIVCPRMLVILKLILGPHMEEGRILPFQPSHAQHRTCLCWTIIKFGFLLWFFDISPWSRFSPQSHRRQALVAAFAPASSPEKRQVNVSQLF